MFSALPSQGDMVAPEWVLGEEEPVCTCLCTLYHPRLKSGGREWEWVLAQIQMCAYSYWLYSQYPQFQNLHCIAQAYTLNEK